MTKNTIGVGMIVSGEEDFIRFSLPRAARQFDTVYVVEGCDVRWVEAKNANADGSSLDRTREIIETIAKSHSNIVYFPPAVYKNRNAQRQVYLDQMFEDEIEHCLVIDCDEFYKDEHVAKMYELSAANMEWGIKYDFYNFYTWTRKFKSSAPMERFFRLQPGMKYHDVDGGQSIKYKGEYIFGKLDFSDEIKCFHYNYVISGERLFNKIRFYLERDGGVEPGTPLKPGFVGKDAFAAISKSPSFGTFVPLQDQPSVISLLVASGFAMHASHASGLDLAEIELPAVQYFPSDLLDWFQHENLYGAAIGSYWKQHVSDFQSLESAGLNSRKIIEQLGFSGTPDPVVRETKVNDGTDHKGAAVGASTYAKRGEVVMSMAELFATRQTFEYVVSEHPKLRSLNELKSLLDAALQNLNANGVARIALPDKSSSYSNLGASYTIDEVTALLNEQNYLFKILEYTTPKGKVFTHPHASNIPFVSRWSLGGAAKSIVLEIYKTQYDK